MSHRIVAIGASAGGLRALEQLFAAIPQASDMAFFVIQHLSPDHESMLSELLVEHCKLPIETVKDGQCLEPNRVYVSPPGFIPFADGYKVGLRARYPKNELIFPINVYFESLAQTLGSESIGVILSGTGADGTLGAQAIQLAGGQVYVQAPISCEFPGMPQSVISANIGCVVANSEALWAAIKSGESRAEPSQPQEASQPTQDEDEASESRLDAHFYKLVFERLNLLFGVDFNSYRIASIDGRLRRRMDLLALPEQEAYYNYMESSEEEAQALYQDLLIGVTEFFRDADSFSALAKLALEPRLKARKKKDFRIWVAGCATGEEAYSLYILADETARACGYTGRISIFATDTFKPSIQRAGMGCYAKAQLKMLGAERLERYFNEVSPTQYKIRASVRERIIFAQHNFLVDAPFIKMDMVSCRNVLIYLTAESQQQAFKAFCYALADGATLFLGASESLGECSESFKTISTTAKIFEKQNSILDQRRWVTSLPPGLIHSGAMMAAQSGSAVTVSRATDSMSTEQAGYSELDATALKVSGENPQQVQILEEALRVTRELLEAANEELQVSNEEQQSTNEELLSMNEDLTSLNTEYGRKNEELDALNTNHENLLQSTEDGVLCVDQDLCIRRFNHAIATAFRLLPSDIGRSLTHMAYRLGNIDELIGDVRNVLAGGTTRVERESIEFVGRRFMKRVVPVIGRGKAIEGALLTFTDVTEVSTLSQRFKQAVQAAHMSWWDWNLQSGELNVYSSGDCLLGDGCLLSSRDRAGWMSQVHPDDRARVASSLDAHVAGETEEWICEHRFATEEGGWLWVSNRGVAKRRDAEGKALEMMGTTQDIDSYKKSLIEANYQRDILKVAGDIAQLGAWEYDVETRQVHWSDQIKRIMGVDDSFDPNLEEAFGFYAENDRVILKEAFAKAVKEGTSYDLELECISRAGKHMLTRSSGRAHKDERGRIFKVVGVFQDVTDIFKAERQINAFFEFSPDFQATANFEERFEALSPSWSKQLGFSPDALLAMPISQIVHPNDRDTFSQQFRKVVAGGVASSYQCRILLYKSAACVDTEEELWMSWSMASDESLGLVFISARLVTEERKANQRLEDARIRAEEANRAKSDFLAVMSHELRTPLNPILGFSELLLEEVESEEHKEIARTIVEAGSHLIELINEVLDYSKVEAGKQAPVDVEFSMEALLEEKLRLMRGQLKGKTVEIRGELDAGPFGSAGLPLFVGDESMLKHILRNLIANAIKFTAAGHVDVRIRIDSAIEDVADVIFEVSDSGIGIDLAHQEKIFEAFTQADSSMTRTYGGTGLGLAICKRLVELLGGGISVQSELGKGACFRVQIPLRYISENNTAEKTVKVAAAKSSKPSLRLPWEDGSRKILIVEDSQDSLLFLEKLLTRIGFDYVSVLNGEAALEIYTAQKFQFVAILLDLHMPGMDGLATLKGIRKFETSSGLAAIPIFILTADVHDTTRYECLAHGANDFITKPLAVDVLRTALIGLKPD